MAGSETTSNTLGFAVLYMLLHPDVQCRVHDELDSVVGHSRQPTLQDRPRWEYCK
jgi:cytochrome P450